MTADASVSKSGLGAGYAATASEAAGHALDKATDRRQHRQAAATTAARGQTAHQGRG